MVTYRSRIEQDVFADNPRHEFDGLGTFAMSHRRYAFGDKGAPTSPDEILAASATAVKNGGVALPVFMYDHSGITIRTYPFECPWDSGQIGMIWITAEQIRESWMVMRITAAVRAKVTEALIAEIKTLDDYLTGNVYNIIIEKVDGDDVEVVESVGGVYDHEYAETEAAAMLKEFVGDDN